MSWGVIATPQSCSARSTTHCYPSETRQRLSSVIPPDKSLFSSNLKPFSRGSLKLPIIDLRCRSTTGDSGENESKTVLDAFFLGKALGEALNERLESAAGEFLSIIGRFQAEQQKQLFEFQDEVLEKARRAKEEASREAKEARSVDGVPSSTSPASDSVTSSSAVSSSSGSKSSSAVSSSSGSKSSSAVSSSSGSKLTKEDPFIGFIKD